MINELIKIGFSQKEASVYASLVEIGETPMGPLQKKVGLHKQIVYTVLESLRKKDHVVVTVRNGKRHFNITDPSILLLQNNAQKQTIESLIPKIYARQGSSKQTGEINLYENPAGIRAFLLKMLKQMPERSKMDILGAGGEEFLKLAREQYFFDKYEHLRISKKISHRMLMYENQRNTDPVYLRRKYVDVKFIPETYQQPIAVHIWPDRVSILLFGDHSQILEIKSDRIRDGFQNYFELLWKQDSWVMRGKQGFLDLLNTISAEGQDLCYLNAMGGGLIAFPNEYKTWMKEFSSKGYKSYWLMSPRFNADDSDTGNYHTKRKLKVSIISPTVNWIFGPYVANVLWEGDNAPTVFLIKNKSIAQSHREYFDYLWKHGSVPFEK